MRYSRALATALLVAAIAAGVNTAQAGTPSAAAPATRVPLGTTASGSGTAGTTSSTSAPTRVLVRMKSAPTAESLESVGRSAQASTKHARTKSHDRVEWTVPAGRTAEEFANELMESGKVEYAVPSYTRRILAYTPPSYVSPNDPAFIDSWTATFLNSRGKVFEKYPYAFSWWLRDIRAPQAWALGYTGSDVTGRYPLRASGAAFTVAVLDTGLYSSHEDVRDNVVGGRDLFDHLDGNGALVEDNDVTPPRPDEITAVASSQRGPLVSHGECVAGIIGATANNRLGTVGVGYDTKVVVHKVAGWSGVGEFVIDDGAVVNAIYFATDVTRAKVINMSFGGYENSEAINEAIAYAHSQGVVVVAAKGNDATRRAMYPASSNHVLAVGALDKNASAVTVPASFSNYYQTGHDIMAPGSFVWGLYHPNLTPYSRYAPEGYSIWDGTSMASPVVAGAVAWLWRAAPALSADEITNAVLNSARRRAAVTNYPRGYRMLDMYSAYAALMASYPLLGKPSNVDETVALLGGTLPVSWAVPTWPSRGVTYDVELDGASYAAGTSAGSGSLTLGVGAHSLDVTASSQYNWDDGTAHSGSSITVRPLAEGPSSWSAAHIAGSSATVATPAYRTYVEFEATLHDASSTPLAGASPVVESSTDGVNFAPVPGATPTARPNGAYRIAVLTSSKTYYRLRFDTAGAVQGSVSSAVIVKPKVMISTPSSKSTVSRKRSFRVSGTLKPAHRTGTRTIRVLVKRWTGRRWASYSSLRASVTRHGSYSTYTKYLRLRKGTYRLYARALDDAGHADTISSSYRRVIVR